MKIPRLGAPDVDKLFAGAKEYHKLEDAFNFLKKRMAIFAGLISRQFDKLRSEGVSIDNQALISQVLKSEGLEIEVVNGCANVVNYKEKVIEVPVQDSRTKHLIHSLATQLKKYVDKYPKLREECDSRLL